MCVSVLCVRGGVCMCKSELARVCMRGAYVLCMCVLCVWCGVSCVGCVVSNYQVIHPKDVGQYSGQ